MKFVPVIITTVFALGLTACGGTNQDPLDDQPGEVQMGQVPTKPKPPEEKPEAANVLRIDGADYFVFREGIEQEIVVKGRTEYDDAKYEVEFTNLDQFKGAVMSAKPGDASTGDAAEASFKWTAPKGIVFADVVTYQLDAIIYTTNFEENRSFKKSFNIFIYKESFAVPEILSIAQVTNAVKEGGSAQFKVRVKDIDGTPATKPSLLALTDYTQKNGAPYLSWTMPEQDSTNPAIWTFTVTIDLKNAEITTGADVAEFSLAAVSAAGKKSNPQKASFTVWSSIAAPVTSWIDAVEFKVGQHNHFDFSILDPRGEGKLANTFHTACATLPGAPTCACTLKVGVSGKAETLAACSIDWNVPGDITFQEQKISYETQNKSTLPGDTETKKAIFAGKILLVP